MVEDKKMINKIPTFPDPSTHSINRMNEVNSTVPFPKSWFQMYNEEKQKREDLEIAFDELGIAFNDLKREYDCYKLKINKLPEKWRNSVWRGDPKGGAVYECADELEEALKDE